MGCVQPIDVDLPYPQCPHCRSEQSHIVPVADPAPNMIYLHCDQCSEMWTVRVAPFVARFPARQGSHENR